MGAVTSLDQIVREDLSDLYINVDVRQTPFLTRIKRGEDIENVKFFSWALERYDGRLVTGIPENIDAGNFETDAQTQLYGRTQKFWRQPHVTVESNTINRAPADFGKYNKQVIKKVQEQKRDIEQRIMSDKNSRDDDGTTGREVMGLGCFINDTVSVGVSGSAITFTDTQTTIPTQYLTPTAQIYVSTLYSTHSGSGDRLDFTEKSLDTMLQNRFDNLGKTTELSCFCDALFRVHATRMFQNQTTLTNSTPIYRISQFPASEQHWEGAGVTVVNTDFGPVDINLVSWLPRTSANALSGRAYFLDMEFMYLRASGLFLTHAQLEDKGAGPRGLIQSILGPQWGDPQAHCKVDPNVATGTF